ncbi:MAG: group 1 truncated hemoglobin [Burkholderiales bacterium]|jgi:hemoglobin|nr:group 1 truncated hemoglobin [Burkholderiales bacterium]
MEQTIFDKYGGIPVVTDIVRDFYKRVLRRPNLRRYFLNVEVDHLIQHQVAFVSIAMGRMPHHYVGRNMRIAHQGRGITGASFDLMLELLSDTLKSHEFADKDIRQVMANVKKYKSQIVER